MRAQELIQSRYRLEHTLGQGGMAEVWCARDERLQRPVAVKFLAPQFHQDPEFLVRFFSEAQSVAQLSHPNVVCVLDFGDYEDRPYLVMEYVPGGSTADLTGEPLLPERAVEIVAGAARGAGAAHDAGLVHRDIKPANILLTEEGYPKLADFGIASSNGGEELTATGQALGSPHYISPEQATGAGSSPRSDVYSLGVVLYELLTGRPPFEAENITAIAIAHVDQPPPSLRTVVPDIDPRLEALVMRCLEKDPEQRFADGSQMAVALEQPAAAALFPSGTENLTELEERKPLARRVLIGLVVAGLVATAAIATVWASGDAEDIRPRSFDQETLDQGADQEPKKKRPSPTAAATFTEVNVEPAASSSPVSSETEKEEDSVTEPGAKKRSGTGSQEPEPEPEPSEEPTAEPTTGPSPEPSTEPSPQPTTTP